MTTDESKSKLLEVVKNHYIKISILSYLASFCIFGLLISEYFCERTYFSDNALLPGFVKRDFNFKQQILSNLNELKQLDRSSSQTTSLDKSQINWLTKKFKSFGLQVYTQQFEFNYPFGGEKGQQNKTGTNVYAILKSPRSLSY